MKHFLSSDDVTVEEQATLLARAAELKAIRGNHGKPLEGKAVGLIFEKPSTRTRVSFETAIYELGGHPMSLRSDELQLGRGETLEDTGKVLSRYLSAIVMRTFGQERLEELAGMSSVPVVNALSDLEHPCQALADVMTILENFKDPRSVEVVYLGDGNNVCHSLMLAGAKAGFARIEVACPEGFEPIEPVIEQAATIGAQTGTHIEVSTDPSRAAKGAHVLYTDVWASMGQESEHAERVAAFQPFQLSAERVAEASPDVIVMHCLPAHRDEEIAGEVLDGPRSVVWDQAENRLHAQKALLEWLVPHNRGKRR